MAMRTTAPIIFASWGQVLPSTLKNPKAYFSRQPKPLSGQLYHSTLAFKKLSQPSKDYIP